VLDSSFFVVMSYCARVMKILVSLFLFVTCWQV